MKFLRHSITLRVILKNYFKIIILDIQWGGAGVQNGNIIFSKCLYLTETDERLFLSI